MIFVALAAGINGGGGRSATGGQGGSKTASPTTQPALALPAAMAQKVATLSAAVTMVRQTPGAATFAGTYLGASGYLVVPARGLAVNEKFQALGPNGTWGNAVVAAVDPLTDAAILRTAMASPSFLASYIKDSPAEGSIAFIIYHDSNGAGRIVLADVISAGEPLNVSQKYYIPDAIQISYSSPSIPLGSLVLDAEGDPVGMVVKASSGNSGANAWATPLPSVGRITSLVVQHRGVLHGYVGVIGSTVTLTDGTKYAAGVKIDSVVPGSPAAAAKLPVGSVIVAVDGTEVPSLPALQSLLLSREPGSTVHLQVDAHGGISDYVVGLANHP
ncbi:MAG: S1C family serine protease [Actinomycetota bacterium]|nr:S1C family serine protease [Actinomycetota bacterium]